MNNSIKAMTKAFIPDTGVEVPPTQDELPYDDGVPMETQRHKLQMDLLIDALQPWLDERPDGYVGGNMFVYYSMTQVRNKDFKGPDFFVVLGVPKGERKSWVVWQEDKAPDVVIELLSESTASQDKNEKKLIYQDKMRVGEYFWYDPFNPDDWAGFRLVNQAYQPIATNARNQLVSQALQLVLTRWEGNYKSVNTVWLRWATLEGELLPTGQELERRRAEDERRRAEDERRRAQVAESVLQRTIRNLLAQNMSLEQVAQITGLSQTEVERLGN
jgi:Uma2 family endonuclease